MRRFSYPYIHMYSTYSPNLKLHMTVHCRYMLLLCFAVAPTMILFLRELDLPMYVPTYQYICTCNMYVYLCTLTSSLSGRQKSGGTYGGQN